MCRNALVLATQLGTLRVDDEIVLHTIDKTMLNEPEKRARAVRCMDVEQPKQETESIVHGSAFEAQSRRGAPVVVESPFTQGGTSPRPSGQTARANELLRRVAMNKRQAG